MLLVRNFFPTRLSLCNSFLAGLLTVFIYSFGLLCFVQFEDPLTGKQPLTETGPLLALLVVARPIVLLIYLVVLVVTGIVWRRRRLLLLLLPLLLTIVPHLTDKRLLGSAQCFQLGCATMQVRVVGEGAVVAEAAAAFPVVPTDLATVDGLGVVQCGRHLDMLLQYRALRAFRFHERIREHRRAQRRGAVEIWRWQWKLFSGSYFGRSH